MNRLAVALAVAVSLAAAGQLNAQSRDSAGPPLAPTGARVRLWLGGDSVQQGRLIEALAADDPIVAYCQGRAGACSAHDSTGVIRRQLSEVLRLEQRTGDHLGRGALIGAALGVGVVLLGEALESRDSPFVEGSPRVVAVVGFVGLSAALGAVIGSRQVKWERIR